MLGNASVQPVRYVFNPMGQGKVDAACAGLQMSITF